MKRILVVLVLMIGFVTSGFAAKNEIMGAGASFPKHFYAKAFEAYNKETGVRVNYQAVGSGRGVKEITNKTVDFGASDAFLDNDKLAAMPAETLHIPMCLGAVSVTYHFPKKGSFSDVELRLTPEVLADIFLGKIKKWNDDRIKRINPNVRLPKIPIIVVHRSDSSGTSAIFTDYLAKVSKTWKTRVGAGKTVNWPTGVGGAKNDGVAATVKQLPGAIGYVELAYALSNRLPVVAIKNKSGNYVKPGVDATSLAANVSIPSDTRVSLTDTASEYGYPIAGFTWILLYEEQAYDGRSFEQAKATVDLLWWMIHEGQRYTTPLQYAPLPEAAVSRAEAILKSVTYNRKKIVR